MKSLTQARTLLLATGIMLGFTSQAQASTLPLATSYGLYASAGALNSAQTLSQGQLAQLLAPIALYPDTVLTHILISATYPLEVVQAQRWLSSRGGMSQQQLMNGAESQPWDPSVKALLAFPHLLQKMSDELEWTQNIGDAFLQDEARVLDVIQVLRQQALDANNLNGMENLQVKRVEKHIIIEPIQTQVIYLPYYDTRYVYGHWHWQQHPPRYWHRPSYIGTSVYIGNHHNSHFYWDTGVHIGVNFFFSAFEWRQRHVIVTSHHNTHHYRRPQQIAISHGAQHWRHEPKHRRSVSHGYGGNDHDFSRRSNSYGGQNKGAHSEPRSTRTTGSHVSRDNHDRHDNNNGKGHPQFNRTKDTLSHAQQPKQDRRIEARNDLKQGWADDKRNASRASRDNNDSHDNNGKGQSQLNRTKDTLSHTPQQPKQDRRVEARNDLKQGWSDTKGHVNRSQAVERGEPRQLTTRPAQVNNVQPRSNHREQARVEPQTRAQPARNQQEHRAEPQRMPPQREKRESNSHQRER